MRVEILTSEYAFSLENKVNSILRNKNMDDVIDIKYASTVRAAGFGNNFEYSAMIIFKH